MTRKETAGSKFLVAVPVCTTMEETLRTVHSYLELCPGGFMVGVGGQLPVLNTENTGISADYQRLCILISQLRQLAPRAIIAVDAEGGELFNILRGISPLKSPREYRRSSHGSFRRQFLDHVKRHADFLAGAGVNLNFAPLVDIPRNGYTGYTAADGRSISDSPEEVVWYAREFIRIHRDAGVICSAKHFPGYGHLSENPHNTLSHEEDLWDEARELAPYRSLLKDHHLDGVMMGHSTTPYHPGVPASLASQARTLLREELGFQGVSIADELFMGAISEYYSTLVSGRDDGDPMGESRAVDAWRNNDLIIVSYPVQESNGTVRGVPGGERRLFTMSAAVSRAISAGRLVPSDWDLSMKRVKEIFKNI